MLLTISIKSVLVLNIVAVLTSVSVSPVHGWPEGTFGLPMPKTGCPVGEVIDWETGSYCILKKGDCPAGFSEGFIYWDDAASWFGNDDTRQSSKGVVPDGTYNQNTQVGYCCRNDGPAEKPIQLPSSAPFYLYKISDICQEVKDMYVSEEWVYWSDESSHNLNAESGLHPRVIRSKFSPVFTKLFYCYYQPRPPSIAMETVRNAAYAIVGLVGLLIFVTVVVCITVHICRCYERRRRKRSEAANDACSRPSVSSAAVNCQYVTLQMNDGSSAAAAAAGPAAELDNAANHESVELRQVGQYRICPPNTKPPSYDEVMGCYQ